MILTTRSMGQSMESASRANPTVGLTSAETQHRLEQYGANEITARRPHPKVQSSSRFSSTGWSWGLDELADFGKQLVGH
jgi:hypothetical protein